MRKLLAMAGMAVLLGCSAGTTNNGLVLTESSSRAPDPPSVKVKKSEGTSRSPVEQWTKKQRRCEVGDKGDQRRCIMPFPGS